MPIPGEANGGQLRVLRVLFFAVMLAPVYLGVLTTIVVGDVVAPDGPNVMFLAMSAAFGLTSLVLPRVVAPELDGSSEAGLSGTYRTRFLLRMAFADAPMIVSLSLSIVAGEVLPFVVGTLFTIVGLLRLAPSDRNIAKDQESLYQQGSPYDLRAVLVGGAS